MTGRFGALEIAIVALILILLFGGKKIPELLKRVGKRIREYRKASKEEIKE